MSKFNYQLSVILPTFNESENIIPLIRQLLGKLNRINFQIIIVDDNSPDNTGKIVLNKFSKNKNVGVFIRNEKGLASAILYGLKKAKGNYVAVMDTDFNHDPKELLIMLSNINKCDMVVGSRYVREGGMEDKIRNMLSLIYNRIIQKILRLPTHDNLSGFFMIKNEKLKNFLTDDIFYGYGDYFIRLLFQINQKGLKIREIPVFYKNRIYGESKTKFFSIFTDYTKTVIELFQKS